MPVLYFGVAHASFGLACLAVALDPRGVSGFFYHSRMLAIVHLVTLLLGRVVFGLIAGLRRRNQVDGNQDVLGGTPDAKAAATRLLKNQDDIGGAFARPDDVIRPQLPHVLMELCGIGGRRLRALGRRATTRLRDGRRTRRM